PARSVRLRASQGISERQEEAMPVPIDGQRDLLPIDREADAALADIDLPLAGRRLHLDTFLLGKHLARCREAQRGIVWEVAQAMKRPPLRRSERAVRAVREEAILLGAQRLHIVHDRVSLSSLNAAPQRRVVSLV